MNKKKVNKRDYRSARSMILSLDNTGYLFRRKAKNPIQEKYARCLWNGS